MGVKGLDQLNELGRELPNVVEVSAKGALAHLGTRLQKALQDSLDLKQWEGARGELEQSILALPISFKDGGLVLEIEWNDYGDYVDEGVRGKESSERAPQSPFSYKDKMPPASAFQAYANNKGISPYAIARSVLKKGIRGTRWATSVIEDGKLDELLENLSEILVDELQFNIIR